MAWKGEFDMSFSSEPKRPATAGTSKKAIQEAAKQELRGKVTRALQKLADRDTQHSAIDELLKMGKELKPECASVFINLLVEFEEVKSSFARSQSSRLFAIIVQNQYTAAQGQIGRIVSTLSRRLRDLDSSVRDSCAETIGELARLVCAQEVPSAPHTEETVDLEMSMTSCSMLAEDKNPSLELFFRPLFQGVSSADSNQQQGCALAIAHVFFKAGKKLEPHFEAITKKIISVLDSPQFSGKPQLLTAIANVVEVFPEGISPLIRHYIPRVINTGMSSDWNTRKHAMETIETICDRLDTSHLLPFRADLVAIVERNKFDKVKPVRDAAIQAHQVFVQKSLTDRDSDEKQMPMASSRLFTNEPREPRATTTMPQANDENAVAFAGASRSATLESAVSTPPRVPMGALQGSLNVRGMRREPPSDTKPPLTTSALGTEAGTSGGVTLACSQGPPLHTDMMPSKETWDKLLKHFDRMTRQQTQLIEMVSAFSESVRERLETVEQKVFALELRQAAVEHRQSLPGMPPTPSRAISAGGCLLAATPASGLLQHQRLNPLSEAEAEAAVDADFRP